MKKFIVMICVLILGLCACGDNSLSDNEKKEMSEITLKKDGSIESRLAVEGFGADYSADDLKSLIEKSITEYQRLSANAKISLKSCEKTAEDKLSVEMAFNDDEAYAGWNNYLIEYMYAQELGKDTSVIEYDTHGFFAGTISDAYAAGYSLDITLTAVSEHSDKDKVTKADLLSMGDSHIVIMECYDDEPVAVSCYNEILYVSDGVVYTGKKEADISAGNGYEMIVFK